MQRSLAHLINWNLEATDGEIGKVEDFYFDDQTWAVKYLIVKTGGWLSGRKVLISPTVVTGNTWDLGLFPVSLTKEQVRDSPDIDTDKPVSRQHEAELAVYYSWQSTWGPGFYPGAVWGVIPSAPVADPIALNQADGATTAEEDFHLRSAQQVGGYHVHATDGDFGHVADFVFDDQSWQISHLLIDTHNWIGGEKILLDVSHIRDIQWKNAKVVVDLSIEAIKNSFSVEKWTHILAKAEKNEKAEKAEKAGRETNISQHY
jgi:uncharacterized protein YrrD